MIDLARRAQKKSWQQRLAFLQRASLAIVRLTDVEAIGAEIIAAMEGLLPYDHGSIAIVDRDDGAPRLLAHSSKGFAPEQFNAEVRRINAMIRNSEIDGVVRRTITGGKTIRIGDVRQFEGYLSGDDDIRSELCVPVIFANETIGALNVESFELNAFDEDDAAMLSVLANQVALALENAWLSQRADAQSQSLDAAERDTEAAEHMLVDAVESLIDGVVVFDVTRRMVLCNSKFRELYPQIAEHVRTGVTADDLTGAAQVCGQIVGQGPDQVAPDLFLPYLNGDPVSRLLRTAEGRAIEVRESRIRSGGEICLHIDATERHRVEQELAQAQKVEAVGRLTAGVAHDFNNLLAVIMGNLELAEDGITDAETAGFIDECLEATRRGAHLTQQLLQFARRSTLIAKVTDCNAVLSGMKQMFRRTLAASINLNMDLDKDLAVTEIDPVQLETAILNLVLNARDSMSRSGTLTIATRNVDLGDRAKAETAGVPGPGQYVMIAVSDTGTGMKPEVLEQVFEPFFTTKPIGKGTGLGLPMVFGFAQQSGGTAQVISDPGKGTSVSLYFPAHATGLVADRVVMARGGARPGGKGCIMVVEDFEDVRSVVVGRLKRMGYDTVEAENGDNALAILRSGVQIDLLLADIVMPGKVQGPELVAIAMAEAPTLKAVLMSGYPKGARALDTSRDLGIRIIAKPISRLTLEQVISEMLKGDGGLAGE